jgi:CRP/FNR family transcriptional regulator, anaerobic regulatory protein
LINIRSAAPTATCGSLARELILSKPDAALEGNTAPMLRPDPETHAMQLAPPRRANPQLARIPCSSCALRELCLPVGISDATMVQLDALVGAQRSLRRGETLLRAGDPFKAIYAVRAGFFKTRIASPGGRERVTGFQMAGELLGLEAIGGGAYLTDAVALEDSQVCSISYAQLERLAQEFVELQRQFHRVMSREIASDCGLRVLLGSKRSEALVGAFLLDLGERLQARGFSRTDLILRMTREDIGSYLGLKLETVSRAFSSLQAQGLLDVSLREVRVLDEVALRELVERS